jgi:gluconate 2-dehydrogenase gamma chain
MVAVETRLDAKSSPGVSRRELLVTTAISLIFSTTSASALVVKGGLPWSANAGAPPTPVQPGPWVYFTAEEGAAIEALVDRLIPPDAQTPGGKDAGCAVFIDRQLAGPYGKAEGLYMRGPFADGTPQQGGQSSLTPAARYRQAWPHSTNIAAVNTRESHSPSFPTTRRTSCSPGWRKTKCALRA